MWTKLVIVYLVLGSFVLPSAMLLARLNDRMSEPTTYQKLFKQIILQIKRFFGICLFTVLGVLLWPLALMLIVQTYFGKSNSLLAHLHFPSAPKTIKVIVLTEFLSLEEIEAKETVSDMLDSHCHQPFGYLNENWKIFLQKLLPGDTLRAIDQIEVVIPKEKVEDSINIDEDEKSDADKATFGKLIGQGYAIVRGNKVIDSFLAHG